MRRPSPLIGRRWASRRGPSPTAFLAFVFLGAMSGAHLDRSIGDSLDRNTEEVTDRRRCTSAVYILLPSPGTKAGGSFKHKAAPESRASPEILKKHTTTVLYKHHNHVESKLDDRNSSLRTLFYPESEQEHQSVSTVCLRGSAMGRCMKLAEGDLRMRTTKKHISTETERAWQAYPSGVA